MLTKNPLAIWLTFNKRYRFKSTNYALSSVAKSTNPAEGVKNPKCHPPCRLASRAW